MSLLGDLRSHAKPYDPVSAKRRPCRQLDILSAIQSPTAMGPPTRN